MELVYSNTHPTYFPNHVVNKSHFQSIGIIPSNSLQSLIENRKETFTIKQRQILTNVLKEQYANIESITAFQNIESLTNPNTFTLTTGQQIHIFLGPMYVHNKILSLIHETNLAKEQYPNYQFVPIFWMATEDHDIAEIDYINFNKTTYNFTHNYEGPSGNMPTQNLNNLLDEIIKDKTVNLEMVEVFKIAYTKFLNLADATRYIIDKLYGHLGIICIDPNNLELKKQLQPVMKMDILESKSVDPINDQTKVLKNNSIIPQIAARACNFFILNTKRLRLDKENNTYKTNEKTYSIKEIENVIDNEPNTLSPNVCLRPIYQEIILPNLAYIAGPSEFTYWLQLTNLFKEYKIQYPLLLARKSITYLSEKSWNKLLKIPNLGKTFYLESSEIKKIINNFTLGENEIDKVILMINENRKTILNFLTDKKSKKMQAVLSMFKEMDKKLNTIRSENAEELKNNRDLLTQANNLLKLIETFFSKTNVWEREVYMLETLVFTDKSIQNTKINLNSNLNLVYTL